VGAIRKATLEEIAAVPGIGEKIASIIAQSLPLAADGEPHVDLGTGEIRG